MVEDLKESGERELDEIRQWKVNERSEERRVGKECC